MKLFAGTAAMAVGIGLSIGAAGTAKAATPAWTSVGRAGVPGAITALASVRYGGGRTGEWAFQTTATLDPKGYPSVYSRSDAESWGRQNLPGSKPGEIFVAAGAISNTNVLAFTKLPSDGGRVWHFNGHTWSVIKTFGAQIGGAKVLSATNVFVFGNTSGAGALGVWHYDGHTWKRIASTLVGGSADSASNAWAFTGTTVGHWDGKKWTGTNLASLLPARTSENAPSIVSVIAASATTAFAVGTGGARNYGGPTVVLAYNGRTWSKVGTYTGVGNPGLQLVSLDRQGGLWLPLYEPNGPSIILHYLNGTFTKAALPAPATASSSVVYAINQIPDTTSELAAGSAPSGRATPSTYADILYYH